MKIKSKNAGDARIRVDILNCHEKERNTNENRPKKESETIKSMNENKTIEIQRKLMFRKGKKNIGQERMSKNMAK